MEQRSFFGLSKHLELLSRIGDPLERLEATIDLVYFPGCFVESVGYGDASSQEWAFVLTQSRAERNGREELGKAARQTSRIA